MKKSFSLAGYFFGEKLQQLNEPIGLINASWGGIRAEAWTPKDTIENHPILKEAADHLKPVPCGQINAGAIYKAMIYPITNFSIAGVIWYQGEANVGNALTYGHLLSAMINSWRKVWQKNLPFYFVQIAPFAGYGKNISSALLREGQAQALSTPNTGMILIDDLVSDINDIHPKNKKDVGLRLANYALAETYGKKVLVHKSLMYRNMKIEKNKIRIYFDNAENGLISKGGAPDEFYIAGDDKKFMPASTKIEGNTVVVWNKKLKSPVAVRFGFTNSAMPDLFSKEGLPVNIFRTDDWNEINTIQE
ncbi:MAG: sialate O-acetylesterase [Ginsengibacter sp.]